MPLATNEVTNDDRAEWAGEALRAFARKTRQLKGDRWDDDLENVVGDLLCDLMHLCDRDGVDFARVLKNARGNYKEERASEE